MKKYLLTFFGGDPSLKYENLDKAAKEVQEKHRAAWAAWIKGLAQDGKFEAGYPLVREARKVTPAGVETHRFPEDSEGGFTIIKAESLDHAAEIARTSPIIKNGGTILVRECMEMGNQ
jgi:hypothetical protein